MCGGVPGGRSLRPLRRGLTWLVLRIWSAAGVVDLRSGAVVERRGSEHLEEALNLVDRVLVAGSGLVEGVAVDRQEGHACLGQGGAEDR